MSGHPITTANIVAFAAQIAAFMRHQANGYHARAIAEAGAHTGPWPGMIDAARDDVSALRVLRELCLLHADAAAAASIGTDLDATIARLIQQSHEARMASVPGWDPVAKAFIQRSA